MHKQSALNNPSFRQSKVVPGTTQDYVDGVARDALELIAITPAQETNMTDHVWKWSDINKKMGAENPPKNRES